MAARLVPLLDAGQVAVSGVLELEVLHSARSHPDFVAIRDELSGYPRLALAEADLARAVEVMELLARRGQHRAAGVLLHYDAGLERIAAVTGQPTQWVVPRGSIS